MVSSIVIGQDRRLVREFANEIPYTELCGINSHFARCNFDQPLNTIRCNIQHGIESYLSKKTGGGRTPSPGT